MNEERIKEIKDKIRSLMEKITSIGEEPPEFIQDLLLQVIQKSHKEIESLRSNELPKQSIEPTVSNDAQLLWILSGSQPQAFISYLRTYPTQETQSLINNPVALNATIERLNQMMPEGQPQTVGGIPHADLNSSNIWGANYDPKSGKMRVRFQGGSVYEYDGVPENIFKAFIKGNAVAKTNGQNKYGKWWKNKSPSLGASMNQYIKAGRFPYKKIR